MNSQGDAIVETLDTTDDFERKLLTFFMHTTIHCLHIHSVSFRTGCQLRVPACAPCSSCRWCIAFCACLLFGIIVKFTVSFLNCVLFLTEFSMITVLLGLECLVTAVAGFFDWIYFQSCYFHCVCGNFHVKPFFARPAEILRQLPINDSCHCI